MNLTIFDHPSDRLRPLSVPASSLNKTALLLSPELMVRLSCWQGEGAVSKSLQ